METITLSSTISTTAALDSGITQGVSRSSPLLTSHQLSSSINTSATLPSYIDLEDTET